MSTIAYNMIEHCCMVCLTPMWYYGDKTLEEMTRLFPLYRICMQCGLKTGAWRSGNERGTYQYQLSSGG
jgi:hypothetical protein